MFNQMRIKMKIQDYLQQQENILQHITQERQFYQRRIGLMYINYIMFIAFALWILNTVVGGVLYYLDLSPSWFAHEILYWVSGLYLTSILIILVSAEYHQYRYVKQKKAVLPPYISATKIDEQYYCSAEERRISQLNRQLADFFQVEPVDLYVLPHEYHVQVISYQWKNHQSILMTWGVLYQRTPQEWLVLLYIQYYQILSTETQHYSRFYHLLLPFNLMMYIATEKLQHHQQQLQKHSTSLYHRLQIIWAKILIICASADYGLQILFKRFMDSNYYTEREKKYKQHLTSSIIYHQMCSALKTSSSHHLAVQFFCAYLPCDISQHYYSKYSQEQIHMFAQTKPTMWSSVLYYVYLMQGKPLSAMYGTIIEPIPYPYHQAQMMRESQHSHLNRDMIRPLPPKLRQAWLEKYYLNKIFQTQAHYLHSISLILMLRKNPQLNFNDVDISATVCMTIKGLDERLLIEILRFCAKHIQLPKSIAHDYLQQWVEIIHQSDYVSVIDALLFEELKYYSHALKASPSYQKQQIIADIVLLFDSLIYLQPEQQLSQSFKIQLLQQFYHEYEMTEADFNLSKTHINYALMFYRIAGLAERERLFLLYLVERFLLEYQNLTQEGLDVLVLLYWRFGFATDDFIQHIYQRSRVTILSTAS